MGLRFDWVTMDCHDPRAVAGFWAAALDDYELMEDPDGEGEEDNEFLVLPVTKRGPKLLFLSVPDDKVVKNRVHFDIRPAPGSDAAAEVARLEGLGAKKIDIGQKPDDTWTVMADIEGNEFCVLRALTDEERSKYAAWAW